MEYLVVGGSWALYLFLHSALATNGVKKWVADKITKSERAYRFIYSLLSTIGLLWLLMIMAITDSIQIFKPSAYVTYGAMVLASYGVILIIVSFRQLSMKEFVGLKKQSEFKLIKTGLHGHVRHPIYSGTILLFSGMCLYYPTDINILVAGVVFLYLPFGIYLEERKLIEVFGEEYLDYTKKVSAIFPRLFRF
jgi:protein-S-isoprenylcysteine O-methyltransferase Ste14